MPGVTDILLFAGQPFALPAYWRWGVQSGSIFTPYDLTGYTARLLIGPGFAAASPIADWTTANGKLVIPDQSIADNKGKVIPNVSAADTQALQTNFVDHGSDAFQWKGRRTWLLGPYYLRATNGGGVPEYMLQGTARLVPVPVTP